VKIFIKAPSHFFFLQTKLTNIFDQSNILKDNKSTPDNTSHLTIWNIINAFNNLPILRNKHFADIHQSTVGRLAVPQLIMASKKFAKAEKGIDKSWGAQLQQTGAQKLDLPLHKTTPRHLHWVLEQKDNILALHSSEEETGVFTNQCQLCELWFMPCMYTDRNRKSDMETPLCRWCEEGDVDPNKFLIHRHIHCNTRGEKRCGVSITMELSPGKITTQKIKKQITQEKRITFEDIAQPEILIRAKMSLNQKKEGEEEGEETECMD